MPENILSRGFTLDRVLLSRVAGEEASRVRCVNMAHIRQSRPGSGLVFQDQVLTTFDVVASWLSNDYFTEMCSGSDAGSHVRRIDFVYHSTLGLRVIKKEEEVDCTGANIKPYTLYLNPKP